METLRQGSLALNPLRYLPPLLQEKLLKSIGTLNGHSRMLYGFSDFRYLFVLIFMTGTRDQLPRKSA